VPDWAKEALTNMGKAVINRDNSLNASSTITRAQFALMLYDLLSK
jgi:molecular chaperone DnaK (HSP70)